MENHWSDEEAARAVEAYAADGVAEDLALRVYTTRLLGSEPRLVLHGGGNTSVKSTAVDLTGSEIDVLYVKGSGWDMGTIEPAGLPAVQMAPLLDLAELDALSDEDMVNFQRRNLLDSFAPNPSVETLLHAWVADKFIDHTHANAALVLTDQADGQAICSELYGDRMPIVPYIMPGFDLAKACKRIADENPTAEGLVLLKHGLFTFGATAREAYERMIDAVTAAEERIEAGLGAPLVAAGWPGEAARAEDIAPTIRGLLANDSNAAEGLCDRFVLDFRTSPAILDYVGGEDLATYSQVGTVTPDHAIRTKPLPVVLSHPVAGSLADWSAAAGDEIDAYRMAYVEYFERHNPRYDGAKHMLDTSPRVVLVPGVGLFGAGSSAAAARATADLAETTVEVITATERMASFESISEAELFDIEYWSLEQAKLAGRKEGVLARHIVAVTGGAGAIGRATAEAFRALGAEIALLDLPGESLDEASELAGGVAIPADVTDATSVDSGVRSVVRAFGGLDILVSNAGAAWQGGMADLDDEVLRQSFELNFFGHQNAAKAAVSVMREQGTGGVLLFNVSKQAVNPGPNFGPYGLPKAATMGLVRQYAIEHGRDGIRSNGVNADRIRSGILTEDMVSERADARGVSETDYMSGNLLGREVLASDVGDAFVAMALARKTTGAVLTVDGGNVAAALR